MMAGAGASPYELASDAASVSATVKTTNFANEH